MVDRETRFPSYFFYTYIDKLVIYCMTMCKCCKCEVCKCCKCEDCKCWFILPNIDKSTVIREIEHDEYESVHDFIIKSKLNELIRDYNKKVGIEDETWRIWRYN